MAGAGAIAQIFQEQLKRKRDQYEALANFFYERCEQFRNEREVLVKQANELHQDRKDLISDARGKTAAIGIHTQLCTDALNKMHATSVQIEGWETAERRAKVNRMIDMLPVMDQPVNESRDNKIQLTLPETIKTQLIAKYIESAEEWNSWYRSRGRRVDPIDAEDYLRFKSMAEGVVKGLIEKGPRFSGSEASEAQRASQ